MIAWENGFDLVITGSTYQATNGHYLRRVAAMNRRCCAVAVRVRPLTNPEVFAASDPFCLSWNVAEASISLTNLPLSFAFDTVMGPDAVQAETYDNCCKPMLDDFFQGFNCCLFAYGQTGAGKSFTMGSAGVALCTGVNAGIIPRAAENVSKFVNGISLGQLNYFKICAKVSALNEAGETTKLRVSFIEIHNEELRDLLRSENEFRKPLKITEDPVTRNIMVVGAVAVEAAEPEDLLVCLQAGASRRATASNRMNSESSRSHAIFMVHLEQSCGADGSSVSSKFYFVDLAGSERVKRTASEGLRLREGISINSGLLALSNVINALTEDCNGTYTHVPYRDSKLTRLLQDALGGNARTLMIACISGAWADAAETRNTLRYAGRAREIKNTPVVNKDARTAMVEDLQRQIHELTSQLLLCRRQLIASDKARKLLEEASGISMPVASPRGVEQERLASPTALRAELAKLSAMDGPLGNADDKTPGGSVTCRARTTTMKIVSEGFLKRMTTFSTADKQVQRLGCQLSQMARKLSESDARVKQLEGQVAALRKDRIKLRKQNTSLELQFRFRKRSNQGKSNQQENEPPAGKTNRLLDDR